MKCPNCVDTTLVMSDRQGLEIDYCPACRGVWLEEASWISSLKNQPSYKARALLNPGQRQYMSINRRM